MQSIHTVRETGRARTVVIKYVFIYTNYTWFLVMLTFFI